MTEDIHCTSCGVRLLGPGKVRFKCPECGQTTIGRCAQCRDQSVHYVCSECKTQGP